MKEFKVVKQARSGQYAYRVTESYSLTMAMDFSREHDIPSPNAFFKLAKPELYEWLQNNTRGEISVVTRARAIDPATFEPMVTFDLIFDDKADATAYALRWS